MSISWADMANSQEPLEIMSIESSGSTIKRVSIKVSPGAQILQIHLHTGTHGGKINLTCHHEGRLMQVFDAGGWKERARMEARVLLAGKKYFIRGAGQVSGVPIFETSEAEKLLGDDKFLFAVANKSIIPNYEGYAMLCELINKAYLMPLHFAERKLKWFNLPESAERIKMKAFTKRLVLLICRSVGGISESESSDTAEKEVAGEATAKFDAPLATCFEEHFFWKKPRNAAAHWEGAQAYATWIPLEFADQAGEFIALVQSYQ